MKWSWPLVIIFSALAAGLVNFVLPDLPGRPFVMLWFLCVCPGMMFIRFFRLKEVVAEWTLAIALSLVIDVAVAIVQLYTGHWSPSATLAIIITMCIIGVIINMVQIGTNKA